MSRRSLRGLATALLGCVALAVSCDGDDGGSSPSDMGPALDAGRPRDAADRDHDMGAVRDAAPDTPLLLDAADEPDAASVPDAGTERDGGRADAGSATEDAGPSDAALGDASGFGSGRGTFYATSLEVDFGGMPVAVHNVGARFRADDSSVACATAATVGVCVYERCTGLPVEPVPPLPHAGTLEVRGGASDVRLSPMADGSYEEVIGMTPLWRGGEELTFAAHGGDVAAFAVTLHGVPAIVLSEPTIPEPPSLLAIDRSLGLPLAWMPDETGVIVGDVLVVLTVGEDPAEIVRCRFEAAAASAVAPPELLGMLPPGRARLNVLAQDHEMVELGAWSIEVFTMSGSSDTASHSTVEVDVALL